ncbi:MAG: hypothetical protein EXS35_04105 [Pedosphaera sp.]|nr:hypothetical protein [Pedosphaera sp.]
MAALFLNWQAGKRLRAATEVIEQTASNEVKRAYSTATNQLARQFQIFAQDASNQLAEAYSSVTNQITEEFQTPRIKQTVEAVAKGEAKFILESEVQPVVTNFTAEVAKTLNALTSEQDFLAIATRARAHDYRAYLELRELASQTNPIGRTAEQVVSEIERALDVERSTLGKMVFFEGGTKQYGGPFTSDEIALKLKNEAKAKSLEGVVNAARDLNQPLFLAQFVKLLTDATDLMVADRLTLSISELTKEDFRPRDIEQIKSWWNTHKNSYTNWPYEELDQGLRDFGSANYSAASKII